MVDEKNAFQAASDNSRQIEKTRSITFRLNSSILEGLQREANQKEISLNVLINQILKRYSDWDRYENKIGMMPVPKMMLKTLIDKAIITANNGGIKDVQPYRDEIVKDAAKIAFGLMKESVPFYEEELQSLDRISGS